MGWLCDFGLGDADLDAVCQGVRRGGSRLTSLDLSNNAIGDAGIQRLVAELAKGTCPRLSELWVGNNAFGELGLSVLKSGLGALRRGLKVHYSDANDASAPATATDIAG